MRHLIVLADHLITLAYHLIVVHRIINYESFISVVDLDSAAGGESAGGEGAGGDGAVGEGAGGDSAGVRSGPEAYVVLGSEVDRSAQIEGESGHRPSEVYRM